ncbi:MAG TPA: DUF3147 family protein [Candidatus Dormibacteraeota bacterium]
MKDVLIVIVKAVAGGAFVALFALLSDALKPKTFSGLFSAAPSIAMASLLVTALATGHLKAAAAAIGMIAGAIGMVAYCIAASYAVERFGAVAGSALAWVAWLACAGIAYLLILA